MKHPPYHLRPNKAIDRVLLASVLSILGKERELCRYTYFGFGGPFLIDIRVLSQHFPALSYVSLERDIDTHRRQKFHQNAKNVKLIHTDLGSFLKQQFQGNSPCIFWLDYTDLKPERIEEFTELLALVPPGSIVKLTVRAQMDSSQTEVTRLEEFQSRYIDYLPHSISVSDTTSKKFAALVQSMFQIAAQKALPDNGGTTYQLVHSCRYNDGTQMLSITGVVCEVAQRRTVRKWYSGWPHRNLTWKEPEHIDVPDLSMKERLRLERHLPSHSGTGKALQRILGYKIDYTNETSRRKLRQYQDFHQYYPLFAQVTF